jgi:uncharacterized protein YndB with AHSA1/START domain
VTEVLVKAPVEAVWQAFMDPAILVQWLPPAQMTGAIHRFAGGVGGGYEMSLTYPDTETAHRGKTTEREDRVRVKFIAVEPPRRIVEAVTFVSDDPRFAGVMTIEILLEPAEGGTRVEMRFSDLPPGLKPEENEEGARISLGQLAARFG